MTTATQPVLRRSALEAADSCLYRFDQLENRGVPDTSDVAQIGILFHAAVCGPLGYVPRLAKAQVASDADLAALAFQEALANEHAPSELLEEVDRLYLDFVETFELDVDAFLLAEQRQAAAGVTWQPDLIYCRYAKGMSELEIVDLKTWRHMLTDDEAKRSFQAQVYAWQARMLWPNMSTYRFTFLFTRFNKRVSVVFTHADLDAAERRVQVIVGRIAQAREQGVWSATPGDACHFCRIQCPILDDAKNAALVPQRILSVGQAQEIGGELLVLQQAYAQRRELLKAWVEAEGPVVVNGMEFASRPSERQTFPIDRVMAILESAAITPTFPVSKSSLRSYLTTRKYAHVREPLLEIASTKTTFTFGPKKVGSFGELFAEGRGELSDDF